MNTPPLARLPKTTVYRIIPSRFPPVDLYRKVAPAEDWVLLQRMAMRTNQRLVEEAYSSGLIRPEDRIVKSSSSFILGPLSRLNVRGSRFADKTFGAVYVGLEFETAQAEVIAQREAFMRATLQKPQRFDMRCILLDLEGELHDLRQADTDLLADIGQTQALARKLRLDGSYGVVFKSLVRPGGHGVAVFRPPVLSNWRQERHFNYHWDGKKIADVFEYSRLPTGSEKTTPSMPKGLVSTPSD